MKKALLFFISLFIGIGLLVWIIRFVGWLQIKSAFLIFTGWHGAIIVLLTFLILLVGAWKWQTILKSQGYNLSNREIIAPYLTYFSITYLFPMVIFGGEIFRGYVLREKHEIPWGKAIASVLIDKILEATSFLVAILAGLVFFLLKIGLPPRNLAIILGGFLLFLFIIGISFFYFRTFKKQSIAKPLIKLFNRSKLPNGDILEIEREIFNFFKIKKKVLWQGFSLAFLRVAVTWLRCWVLILFLGKSVGLLSALSVLGFYYFAMIIPIPTALGSHEVVQVFAFNALGLGSSIAPAFTMIQRGAELMMAFIGLIIFFKLGLGLFQGLLLKKLASFIDK